MYSDGNSMERKRRAYNRVRDDPYYLKFGPIAEPKVRPADGVCGIAHAHLAQ